MPAGDDGDRDGRRRWAFVCVFTGFAMLTYVAQLVWSDAAPTPPVWVGPGMLAIVGFVVAGPAGATVARKLLDRNGNGNGKEAPGGDKDRTA